MNNSVIVSLRDIVVDFDGQRILDGLNLDIHDKEFVTLLGPSGCGKTTTLRLIAGFLEPTSGKVLLKGEDITGVPPYKRPVNTVFQKYALFPHLNVFENVAFGLRLKKMDEETIRRKVRDMLEVVGLKGFERRSKMCIRDSPLPEEADAAKACVGYLPEQPPLYPEMTVAEYLDFAAELKGVKKADRPAQVQSAARRTGLEDVLPRLIRSLSKGYRQRVGVAQALLGSPKLIILDEPTVGLDPAQVIELRRLIRELGRTHTVILSSHILSEVKAVCDKALILSQGHLAAVVDLTEEQRDLEELFLALTAPEAASDKKED